MVSLGFSVDLPVDTDPFYVGGDISMLPKLEEAGIEFSDGGQPKDLIQLMMDHGCHCFRVRLFVNPTGKGGVVQDVPYVIKLGRRIKAAGGTFLLDFHYSDTWADPGHQYKPKAWEGMTFDQLEKTVETYTAGVMTEMKEKQALPNIVQIGNEVNGGFIWPDGRNDSDIQWEKFSRLLKAGIRGVRRSTTPEDSVRIMIHVAWGGDIDKTRWFFDKLNRTGIDYDIIGQSYYPRWHGTIAQLEANLAATAERYKKNILLVETAWPYFGAAEEYDEFDRTPEGQKIFLETVVKTVRATPDKRGIGVVWWYPESVPMKKPGGWEGGQNALFDAEGHMLPAMDSFKVIGESNVDDNLEVESIEKSGKVKPKQD